MKSRERQRRARKAGIALAWGVACFVGLQAGLTWAMERWVPHLRAPFYGFKADRLSERLAEAHQAERAGGPAARVVVMLGSSRTADGLRGDLVEEGLSEEIGRPVVLYNFGIAGNTPMNQLLDLERLLDRGIRPDFVLVEVLPSTLSDAAAALLDHLPGERMGVWERAILRKHQQPVDLLTRYSWRCWACPWYAHRLEMLSVLSPAFVPRGYRQDGARQCNRSGWYSAYPTITEELKENASKKALASYAPMLGYFRLGSPFAAALPRTLLRCQQANVPAILVLMPEGSEFRDLYSEAGWRQIEDFLAELSVQYGSPVIDARKWVPDEQFLDTHHLLPDGAETFTRRLARDVVSPFLHHLEEVRPSPGPPPDVLAHRAARPD